MKPEVLIIVNALRSAIKEDRYSSVQFYQSLLEKWVLASPKMEGNEEIWELVDLAELYILSCLSKTTKYSSKSKPATDENELPF